MYLNRINPPIAHQSYQLFRHQTQHVRVRPCSRLVTRYTVAVQTAGGGGGRALLTPGHGAGKQKDKRRMMGHISPGIDGSVCCVTRDGRGGQVCPTWAPTGLTPHCPVSALDQG